MREIVLDTETTGLDPASDRVIEIGAIEIVNLVPTGRHFHRYLNPGREVPESAVAVHGLDAAFLADKPAFAAVVDEFLAFLGEDRLVIHNAAFDLGMLNAELARLGRPPLAATRCVDTLELARRAFPGAPASLDALCRRFGIDNAARARHGALLDAELLAQVYLELRGGRQAGLELAPAADAGADTGADAGAGAEAGRMAAATPAGRPRPRPLRPRLDPAEAAAHRAFVAGLGPDALWYEFPGCVPREGEDNPAGPADAGGGQ